MCDEEGLFLFVSLIIGNVNLLCEFRVLIYLCLVCCFCVFFVILKFS